MKVKIYALIILSFLSLNSFSQQGGSGNYNSSTEYQVRSVASSENSGAFIGLNPNNPGGHISFVGGTSLGTAANPNFITFGFWNRANNSWSRTMYMTKSDRVIIGYDVKNLSSLSNHAYKLYVGGGIRTELVQVDAASIWPDYVFSHNYNLKPLHQVESYINKNHHLEGVPSADEIKEQGINLAQMDATLLQKIEELTLYLIEQQKVDKFQKEEIEALKAEVKKLKKN